MSIKPNQNPGSAYSVTVATESDVSSRERWRIAWTAPTAMPMT